MMKICSAVLPVLAGCALAVLLVIIAHTEDISVTGTRSDPGFAAVKDVTETEFAQEDAPIGIQKEYTFTLDDDIPHDSCLAFYTVHQYVTVYLDGEEIYSIQPAGSHRFTKTVGSNWTMLPLYAEDSGKKVKVDITPVYESFRNREVTFLIGSPLAIYRSRLVKDLPQIILGSMAILMGLAFLGVAVYSLLNVDRGVPEVFNSVYDIRELLKATYYLNDKQPLDKMELPVPKFVLKGALKKVKGTWLEELLHDAKLM